MPRSMACAAAASPCGPAPMTTMGSSDIRFLKLKLINMKRVAHLSKYVNTCQNVGVSLPTTIEATTCCAPRVTAALAPEEAERIARVFKALGDPTRVRLLSLIAAGEGGEACICDLTDPVGL